MSWREIQIQSAPDHPAGGRCVIFTAFAVATATHYLLGLPWSTGFLLGAIVAPPDVVAPLAIARKLGMPRRILVVLEGEGLANDADRADPLSLRGGGDYDRHVFAAESRRHLRRHRRREVLFGAAVGWLSLRARHRARDPQVELTLSLITPYIAYLIPEHFGGSGVIATVACGLLSAGTGRC